MIRLKSVTVTKLFGYDENDYTVDFFPNELITFMYALNGTGKTTLFRLIYAALKRQLTLLDSIAFKTIKIVFDNDESIIVEKIIDKPFDDITLAELPKDDASQFYFPIVYYLINSKGEMIAEGKYHINKTISDNINRLLEENYNENSKLHFPEKKQIFISGFYTGLYVEESGASELREIENFLCRFENINILYANKDYDRLITDQLTRRKKDDGNRLLGFFEEYNPLDTITYPFEYVKKMYEKRFVEIQTMSDTNLDEFIIRGSDEYDKEEKFITFDIPDKIDYLEKELQKIVSDNMLYLLNPDDREKDLCLFEEIINHKPGLSDKDISIDRKTGELEIRLFGKNDILLPPEKLSSGEKNWLLLNFYIIFKAKQGIHFIDEPEVSMHPEWLINFSDNLKMICKGRDIQIIIATHSPSITYYDFDLMTELKRGEL